MKEYKIGKKSLEFPLIQGGMGVGVSLGNLAGAVAREGCMGVISTVQIGYRKDYFEKDSKKANKAALREEIRKAREISEDKGMLAVNLMVAANCYEELLQVALEEGIDAVISGAGLPLKLAKITKEHDVCIAPIVSSGKALKVILKSWAKSNRLPDFVVIEGSGAGGHLGFKKEELISGASSLEEILSEVLEELTTFDGGEYKDIPVFIAGSVFDGKELRHYQNLGALGAQIGTRFIATYECDASEAFSKAICDATEEDILLIQSPVGMPARAIATPFVKRMLAGEQIRPKRCHDCLKTCNPATTPYCISDALIASAKGDTENGLFFSGKNAHRINEMRHVHEVIDEIKREFENAK